LMGLISFSMVMTGALVMYLGSATIYFGGVEVGRRRYRSHVPD